MHKPLPALETIHTVVFDFDGVFTDNKVWVDQDGRESVRCDRADGLALDLVRAYQRQGKLQAELFILSKENAPGIVTGKIFEYLATGKPILAIVPKHTSAYGLLKNKPDCYLAEPDEPGQIKKALFSLLLNHLDKKQNKFSTTEMPDNLIQYSRRNQAQELANLLDDCVENHMLSSI